MDQELKLTEGELFEVSDAVNATLRSYLDRNDPEYHEAIFGTLTNLLRSVKKITAVLLPGDAPVWLADFETRVAKIRSAQIRNPAAQAAVLKSPHRYEQRAMLDGIREFDLASQGNA